MRRLLAASGLAVVIVAMASWTLTITPAAAQAPACAVSPSEAAIDGEEQAALDLMNALRAERGLAPLAASATLAQAATWKSVSMAASGVMNHDDTGRTWTTRIAECGYRASAQVSENLAMGVATGREAVQMWVASPPHARNLFDPAMRAVGVARARGASGWYWTANYGAVGDGGAPDAARAAAPIAPAIAPVGAASPTPPNGPLRIGGTATVNAGRGDCLNVRAAPARSAVIVTCLADGARVRVIGGPIAADGVAWWQLDGPGWVSGEFLVGDGG